MRLLFKRSSRGFQHAEFFDLDGHQCSLQESSLATERAVWLGVDQLGPSYPLDKRAERQVRMHLSRKHCWRLGVALIRFALHQTLVGGPRRPSEQQLRELGCG